MQIVIDISDTLMEYIIQGRDLSEEQNDEMACAIADGTPLPKNHGRLGDLDALEEYFRNVRKELKASDYKNGTEFFVRDEMLLNVQLFIHLCDAIIEADKCTYKETGCGSCKRQLDCPIEAEGSDSE